MKLLVDTHCWLRWMLDPNRLGEEARERIADAATEVMFSAASGWEIAIKVGLGKLELPMDPDQYIPRRLADQGMAQLPISLRHVLEVYRLPPHHADPFDRILVAQARVEKLVLATADAAMLAYDVDVLWADRRPRPRARARRRSRRKT